MKHFAMSHDGVVSYFKTQIVHAGKDNLSNRSATEEKVKTINIDK